MNNEELLQAHNIKPTAIRLLTIKSIMSFAHTFSLEELSTALDTIDRSTVFRTLSLFEQNHLLHGFEDGSGKRKYCLCRDAFVSSHNETHEACHHAHATCRVCGRTFCLDSHIEPHKIAPEGFIIEDVNYIIMGICSDCAAKQQR